MSIRTRLMRLEHWQRQVPTAVLLSDEERRARLDALVARAQRGDVDAQQRMEGLRDLEQRVRARLAREGRVR